jgi:hypothetical protein
MLYKTTTKLFKGIYQYKIVLVCSGAQLFRSGDMAATLEQLKQIDLNRNEKVFPKWRQSYIKTQDDLDYALRLQHTLSKQTDIDVRVESPWITVYTNNKKHIDSIVKINEDHVKYISAPKTTLDQNTIIMPKMDYDYRITLGKTIQEHSAFVEWAENNPKLKVTKSAKVDLLKSRSWGGKHFYITGENNLLMAKMHLGSSIAKIERIIKE